MNMTACEGYFKSAGWHCAPIKAGVEAILYISTPMVLAQGKPLDFYLIDKGKFYEITDDGTAIHEFRAAGLALDQRKNWRGLEILASNFGFKLEDTGEFSIVFPKSELPYWTGKTLELFGALTSWEQEKLGDQDHDFMLADEVELLLRAKEPEWKCERNVTFSAGKSKLRFDFLWGDYLVDAVRPIPQAVNPKLRKAILLARYDTDGKKALFVIDDRTDPEKADAEQAVLGQIAKTIKFTNFHRYFHA